MLKTSECFSKMFLWPHVSPVANLCYEGFAKTARGDTVVGEREEKSSCFMNNISDAGDKELL